MSLAPAESDIVMQRGHAHYKYQDFTLALRDFNLVLDSAPKHPEAWFMRGQCQNALGFCEDAVKSFNTAIRLKPGVRRRARCAPLAACVLMCCAWTTVDRGDSSKGANPEEFRRRTGRRGCLRGSLCCEWLSVRAVCVLSVDEVCGPVQLDPRNMSALYLRQLFLHGIGARFPFCCLPLYAVC